MRKLASSSVRPRCGITRTRSTGQWSTPAWSASRPSMRFCSGASAPDSTPPPVRTSNCCAASKRIQLFRTQPQARQFEAFALAGLVAEAGFAIAFDRRHQRIAQVGQVAIGGGARAAQFLLQALDRDRVARGLEDAVQGGDAFDLVHGGTIMAEASGRFRREACRWKRYRGPRCRQLGPVRCRIPLRVSPMRSDPSTRGPKLSACRRSFPREPMPDHVAALRLSVAPAVRRWPPANLPRTAPPAAATAAAPRHSRPSIHWRGAVREVKASMTRSWRRVASMPDAVEGAQADDQRDGFRGARPLPHEMPVGTQTSSATPCTCRSEADA